ncbi:Receptor-like protein [Quillaja saponaria]|uniref:Receptor-like protein n=1 Tax=Quillaja saponaria TaxID=32244 RepID=A0AAD7PUS4_QUISA|nr:Receptor-like protein [Quillaja saponaria]
MSSLQVLDLSNNSLDGSIPQCLFNFSYSLQVVNLKSNNLQGGIPQSWSEVNNLKLINLSQNKIQGQLPKSLAYCTALENLDVSDNQLNDVFPTYLAAQDQGYSECSWKIILMGYGFGIVIGFAIGLRPLCHDNESFALLQFKQSLTIKENTSSHVYPYSKIASWKLVGDNTACCLWEGVDCDENSGHVIGLDLSNSNIYGSFNSSSTLFHLVHLQSLNLALNDFSYSEIPAKIGQLSRLTNLNLSSSVFSGNVPSEISQLANLSSLDLSDNVDADENHILKLGIDFTLENLVRNLTKLEYLHLRSVDIFSRVPEVLSNLSSLKSLVLTDCGLCGEFPIIIFHLPDLRNLRLDFNRELNSYLVDFNIWNCNFFGSIPAQLGNLKHLINLKLFGNHFSGLVPSSIGNLTELRVINLGSNQLTGPFPHQILTLSKLTRLRLAFNNFQGPIPISILDLYSLELLDLSDNEFSGTLRFEIFSKFKSLTILRLSNNKLSLLNDETIPNVTFPKFQQLGLNSCNLTSFPYFLRDQDKLVSLGLKNNKIAGRFPYWMWNCSKETLKIIDISDNSLIGFHQLPVLLPWASLTVLDFSNNMLQGSIPIPQSSILFYHIPNNSLTGEIPLLICSMSSLQVLDLSDNSLDGSIPPCLFNFSSSLQVVNLKSNNLQGCIPQSWTKVNNLMLINLSQNKLQGQLPKSLANCSMLENLDVSENKLKDFFPTYLAALPKLKILILRSNEFHGPVNSSETINGFPYLAIIDLSYNSFTGEFPFKLFQDWTKRKTDSADHLAYMHVPASTFEIDYYQWNFEYNFTITMTSKGMQTVYQKVQEDFTGIDISSNKFEGEIPNFIGDLKGLNLLNLSNNMFIGSIPTSLGSLAKLESLDMSRNKLFGQIPQELVQLTFLEFFNVSYNNLNGPIPQGKQFDTFENNSFFGNLELCGNPLSKKCGSLDNSSPLLSLSEEDQGYFEFSWKIILMGYGFGLVIGFAIGLRKRTLIVACGGEGVTCDDKSGNVIVLDLSSSNLYGSINSNSTLFQLVHLQRLDLADNDFNHSQIPAAVRYLSRLTYLNLSSSVFAGHVPAEILQLSKLSSLDLSNNQDPSTGKHVLKLGKHLQLGSLVGNLKQTRTSSPQMVKTNFNDQVPRSLVNCTLLENLDLGDNQLNDIFPSYLAALPNLKVLILRSNKLYGPINDSETSNGSQNCTSWTSLTIVFLHQVGNLLKLESSDSLRKTGFLETSHKTLQELNFLAFFNVSFNNLKGLIPRGRQFETFGNNSFLGNAELCGYPLTRKCANLENSPPLPSTTEEEEHDLFGCGWKIIMMGYGCGLVIGFSIGYTVITGKSYWFTKILRRSRRLHRRVNRRGCRN